MIHEATGSLPCRGGREDLLLPTAIGAWSITTRYRLFGGLERIPTQSTLMERYSKAPLTYSRESADNVVGVSALWWSCGDFTTWSRAQLWVSSCTFHI
jgi:hypothetical protein